FHTVGTAPEPVILSARAINATRVYLLHTKDTEKLCERIEKELGWGVDRIKTLQVGRSEPEDIYKQVRQQIDRLDPTAPIAFDPTGGTKAMVAGLAMFAFSLAEEGRTAHVYYVDNEEYDDQLRRPVAGTEYLKRLENPRDVVPDWLYHRAREAYAQGDFLRAEELFRQASKQEDRANSPEAILSCAYKMLDAAQFQQAGERLSELLDLLQNHPHRQSPLVKHQTSIQAHKQGLEAINQLTNALTSKEKDIAPLADRIKVAWTLAALSFMADRRLNSGRTAEAALLSYRSLEFFLQHRLALRGFDTAKPDYARLSEAAQTSLEALQAAYQNERKNVNLKAEDNLERKNALDFISAFLLLRVLGDEAVLSVKANKVIGLANSRNESVFAHGFTPPRDKLASELSEVLQTLTQSGKLPEVEFKPISLS
uniref:TIGR02710 family CRISPR-associated CARF protein n=1 Tax=uncultured Meiothermus sp. TaxID=157471 RepID=UPI0026269AE2